MGVGGEGWEEGMGTVYTCDKVVLYIVRLKCVCLMAALKEFLSVSDFVSSGNEFHWVASIV